MADQRLSPETEASIIDSIGDMSERELNEFLDTGSEVLAPHFDDVCLSIEYGVKEHALVRLQSDAGHRNDQLPQREP